MCARSPRDTRLYEEPKGELGYPRRSTFGDSVGVKDSNRSGTRLPVLLGIEVCMPSGIRDVFPWCLVRLTRSWHSGLSGPSVVSYPLRIPLPSGGRVHWVVRYPSILSRPRTYKGIAVKGSECRCIILTTCIILTWEHNRFQGNWEPSRCACLSRVLSGLKSVRPLG